MCRILFIVTNFNLRKFYTDKTIILNSWIKEYFFIDLYFCLYHFQMLAHKKQWQITKKMERKGKFKLSLYHFRYTYIHSTSVVLDMGYWDCNYFVCKGNVIGCRLINSSIIHQITSNQLVAFFFNYDHVIQSKKANIQVSAIKTECI